MIKECNPRKELERSLTALADAYRVICTSILPGFEEEDKFDAISFTADKLRDYIQDCMFSDDFDECLVSNEFLCRIMKSLKDTDTLTYKMLFK